MNLYTNAAGPWVSRQRNGHAPARRVVAPTGGIVRGRFPSVKAGRMVSFEQLLERDALYLFEFCPLVADIREQPFKFHYTLAGKVRRYTPDFELTMSDGSFLVIEVKPGRSLAKPEVQEKLSAIYEAMERQGRHFKVLSDAEIRVKALQDNLKRLHCHLQSPVTLEQRHLLRQFIQLHEGLASVPISDLARYMGSWHEVLRLVAHGVVGIDHTHLISGNSLILLPPQEVSHVLANWL